MSGYAFNPEILRARIAEIRLQELKRVLHKIEKVELLLYFLSIHFDNLETFDVTNVGDFVYLNMIEVKEQRKGTGKQVMEIFCSFLDAKKLPCRLTVDPHYGTDYDVLQKFYRSFGFENYDIEGVELIREPKE